MVLEGGKIKEYENPNVLLASRESAFYALCKDAGLVGSGNNAINNDNDSSGSNGSGKANKRNKVKSSSSSGKSDEDK